MFVRIFFLQILCMRHAFLHCPEEGDASRQERVDTVACRRLVRDRGELTRKETPSPTRLGVAHKTEGQSGMPQTIEVEGCEPCARIDRVVHRELRERQQ